MRNVRTLPFTTTEACALARTSEFHRVHKRNPTIFIVCHCWMSAFSTKLCVTWHTCSTRLLGRMCLRKINNTGCRCHRVINTRVSLHRRQTYRQTHRHSLLHAATAAGARLCSPYSDKINCYHSERCELLSSTAHGSMIYIHVVCSRISTLRFASICHLVDVAWLQLGSLANSSSLRF